MIGADTTWPCVCVRAEARSRVSMKNGFCTSFIRMAVTHVWAFDWVLFSNLLRSSQKKKNVTKYCVDVYYFGNGHSFCSIKTQLGHFTPSDEFLSICFDEIELCNFNGIYIAGCREFEINRFPSEKRVPSRAISPFHVFTSAQVQHADDATEVGEMVRYRCAVSLSTIRFDFFMFYWMAFDIQSWIEPGAASARKNITNGKGERA